MFCLFAMLANVVLLSHGFQLLAEQAFWNGMDIGIYFGGKVTGSPSDNDSMYALFSVDLKENRDAVGGFGSCFPVYMGLHYINDPQHHTYYGQGTTTAKIREKDVAYWNATKKVPRVTVNSNLK